MNQPIAHAVTDMATREAGPHRAIARAAARTGMDFDFLLAQARLESGLDSEARAHSSSASGLFQFIEQTWLDVFHRHGPRHGFARLAAAISPPRQPGLPAQVRDPVLREQILALRHDPAISALMAGELANENRTFLASALGRPPDGGELYLAHFLGASGAGRFLTALERNPSLPAASSFAAAARANRAIFYEPTGEPRSFAGVMSVVRARLAGAQRHADSQIGEASSAVPPAGAMRRAPDRSPRLAPPPMPSAAATIAPPTAGPEPATPLSTLVARSLADPSAGANAGTQAADHARRAYQRLKAFGL